MMKVWGAPAADDLDDDAAREISSSRPAPVQGAGRRGLRGVTHSVLQLHRMAPRDPADHLMTKGKSASATDDSDDRAARRRCGSSPAPTEPHSVAPVSYNVQRLATRRLPCTSVSHAPPDRGDADVNQGSPKRRVLRSAPKARGGANHIVMRCSAVGRPPR
jgi:hypothetical protein